MKPDDIAVAETHISYVFFVGDRAYKVKKALRFPFIDQSTRELRERLCTREVELNRRLAPDVYLGVLTVADEQGRPIEHVVEMRRMPDDRRLSALVAAGGDVDHCLRHLARDLAAFHARADSSDEIAACASQGAVRALWTSNLEQIQGFVGTVLDRETVDRVAARAERYIAGRGALFSVRASQQHARDGHGDLLADDVFCLDDGPRALDCIEFDDHLRWGDVVADVAFLAMDLERLGATDAADRFLAWYHEFSGESYPNSLADHYIAYRASIRTKVACLKHSQGHEPSAERARSLLDIADRRLDHGRIRLVLIGGLPGTGKSTLAQHLAARTGWFVLRSDEVRKEVTGTAHTVHADHRFGEGIYSAEITTRTYREMLHRAEVLLSHGESVVLDASWVSASHRDDARDVAERTLSDVVQVRCLLDPGVAEQRMRARARAGTDASDADPAIARAMAATMDPWPDAVEISTAGRIDDVTAQALRRALQE